MIFKNIKIILIICMLISAACSRSSMELKVPIKLSYYNFNKVSQADTLIVFLPGLGDSSKDFSREGFIKAIQYSGIKADVVAVDAHLGYYMNLSVLDRLLNDVIKPAKNKGYKKIWLIGISLGGYGSILYAKKYPTTITGIFTIAPFLGESDIINEIYDAGGLLKWKPKQPLSEYDFQRSTWVWLKNYAKEPHNLPQLYIGFGIEDKFASANNLLAAILPKEHVFRVPGAHVWGPWKHTFLKFLNAGILKK